MADFDAGAILGEISGALSKFSESVKVIGEPIEAAGKVIIPAVVARTAFGAGGGFGGKASEKGSGAGGGGGVTLSPVFLIVDKEGERLLTVPGGGCGVTSLVDTIKSAIDNLKPKAEKEE
jgi:uncharacterized spore protein YtfJ